MHLQIDNKPFTQFILILSLCLVSLVIFSIIGVLIALFAYNFNPSDVNNLGSPNVISGMKLVQLLSAIGLFVVPPIIYGFLTSKKPKQQLGLQAIKKPINYLFLLTLMVAITPFLSWVIELNAGMSLPNFMSEIEQWMQESEIKAEKITKAFLTFKGINSLVYILLIVAIVPAIGEELLFRGVLQKIFISWSNNTHIGIWIAAFLFSAIHMQFFGFLPRMLLGALFGYLFLWSKSLWLPILGHLINNGSVVILSYFYPEMVESTDVTMFGEGESSVFPYLISFFASGTILFLIWKVNHRSALKHEELIN